ncbi:MAG: hypothetical protein ACD_57C00390G0001 [uncultured bacterium]|nr:MAG: hypothetical protein ACD_57C00390G0001 [uncultured bacterium]
MAAPNLPLHKKFGIILVMVGSLVVSLLFFSKIAFTHPLPEVFLQSGFGQIVEEEKPSDLLAENAQIVDSPVDSLPSTRPRSESRFLAALKERLTSWLATINNRVIQNLLSQLPRKKMNFDTQDVPSQTIVSQELYALADKSQTLEQLTNTGQGSQENLAQLMAVQPVFPSTMFHEGNRWEITTDQIGQIQEQLPKGIYTLKVLPLPPYDFTNLPQQLTLADQAASLLLGLKPGSGQVYLRQVNFTNDPLLVTAKESPQEGYQHLLVSLFFDQNNSQGFDREEKLVPWAGVTLTLEKQEEQGFGKLLR